MAGCIIERIITTTNPKTIDYYNGKEKSSYSYKKEEAKVFSSMADALLQIEQLQTNRFEQYPLRVIKY